MINGISRRGIVTGTPVPRIDRSKEPPSACISEVWGPEKVQEYLESKYGIQNQPKGDEHMGELKLKREEYLQKRAAGMTKAAIAKEQGVSGPSLVYWLGKWGLKDPVIEEREISRLSPAVKEAAATLETPAPSSDNQEDANTSSPQSFPQFVDKSSSADDNGLYVTVRIRVARADWPEQFRGLPTVSVDRDTLIQVGLACLSNASAWAHKELLDIVGEGDLQTPLQSFMTRKCTEFVPESVTGSR